MASTQYSVVSSYQLMENHIAAAVIDNTKDFSAYFTPANATVLLSIGSDEIFRASVETAGTQTGWTVTDISPLLTTKYPAGTAISAHAFAASGAVVSGGFAILLAVTVTEGSRGFDEVWLLAGPAGSDASSWLVGGASITWTKLVYDAASSVPIQAINAVSLRVTGLYLEHGLQAADPALALATVADPGAPGELRCFLLDVATGASDVWSYYPQEQDIGTENLSVVPGRLISGSSWGLYKLYALDGNPSLTYLPTKGVFGSPNAILFTVPPGASAIASLIYQPFNSISYTDLFVAADGYIGYFPFNQHPPHEAIQLITSPLVTDITQLHVVNCSGTVVLWGLNRSGQLFYTTAALTQHGNPSAWQAPIALLSNVTNVATVDGGTPDTINLFAMAPLGPTTATGHVGNGLIQLNRNASTGTWLSSVHPLPSSTDCITLKTYTTRILLVDSYNLPQGNKPITATVSADCSLIINGAARQVATSDTLTLKTDTSGCVNFIHAVSSLSTPSITLVLPNGSSSTIDPSGAVVKTLANITTPEHLISATYVDASGKTQNLVAPSTNAEAITGVVQGLQAISAKLPSLPRAAVFKAAPRPAALAVVDSEDIGLFIDFGDLVQWVGNVVTDVTSAVFKTLGDELHFVVTIAEGVFHAIVNTVEDALHAITALFKLIGAEIDHIFRWLGFLFDWQDFIEVKNALKGLVNQSMASFQSIRGHLQSSGDAWFAHARANVLPRLSSTPMAKPSNRPLESAWASTQPASAQGAHGHADMRSDPRLGWLKERAGTAPSTISKGASAQTITDNNPLDLILKSLNNLISDVVRVFKTVFVDVGKLISGEITASDFFASVLAAVELLGLDGLQDVFDALMSALETLLSTVQSTLNMPLEIPILSPLYKNITGNDLTLLDAVCLLIGIGITLAYKIATGKSPAAILASAVNPAAVDHAITVTMVNALRPPPVTPAKASTAPVPDAAVATKIAAETSAKSELSTAKHPGATKKHDAEGPDALERLIGALFVVEACIIIVEGDAEAEVAAFAEVPGSERTAHIAFTSDLIVRILRGFVEMIKEEGEKAELAPTPSIAETAWSFILLMAINADSIWDEMKSWGPGMDWPEGGEPPGIGHAMQGGHAGGEGEDDKEMEEVKNGFLKVVGVVDSFVSIVWALWHMVDIGFELKEGKPCPILIAGQAAADLLEPFQTSFLLSKDLEVYAYLLNARVMSTLFVGIARL